MARYPARLSHPVEALCLAGVGPKIVELLEKRLEQHCRETGEPMPSAKGKRPTADKIGKFGAAPATPAAPKRPRKGRPYIPTRRSGAYGILLALLDSKDEGDNSLTQQEICSSGQKYCDASYTVPDHGKFFTAWNGIKTLAEKGLVYQFGNSYSLTPEGEELALRMRVVEQEGGQMLAPAGSTSLTMVSASTSSQTTDSWSDPRTPTGATLTATRRTNTPTTPRASDLIPSSSYTRNSGSSTSHTLARATSSSHYYVTVLGDSDDEPPRKVSRPTKEPFRTPTAPATLPRLQSSSRTTTLPSTDTLSAQPSIDPYNSRPSLARYGSASSSRTNSQANISTIRADVFPRLFDPDYANVNDDQNGSESPALSQQALAQLADFRPLICKRGQYEVCMVVDNREVRSREDRDYIEQKLLGFGITVLKRPLEIGDYAWVARPTTMHSMDMPEEIVLDYICERKRMDDLVSSIKHTRFNEQKFRLTRSGIGNIIYLVETYKVNEVYDVSPEAIQSALAGCQVIDDFFVKRCQTTDQTIEYLASVTRSIQQTYENMDLYVIPDDRIDRQHFLALKEYLKQKQPSTIYHTSYSAFRRLNSKSDAVTVKDMFCKILMTVRGVSAEKAFEIARTFGTPRALFSALDDADDGQEGTTVSTMASADAWPTSTDNRIGQKRIKVIASAASKTGRKKIGPALSEKIANIWYLDEYEVQALPEQ
ncbi:Crossover junction endonuclease mus81 [Actinomortierella ambigua]|nr:Crossover junction endonuclease mus81 [Actinomortierella ambigua]